MTPSMLNDAKQAVISADYSGVVIRRLKEAEDGTLIKRGAKEAVLTPKQIKQ